MSAYYFVIPIALYLTGWLGEFLRYWSVPGERYVWAKGLLVMGWGAHTISLVVFAVQDGPTLSTFLTAVAWLAILLYYAVMWRWSSAVFPFLFPPLSIALLMTAMLGSEQVLLGNPDAGVSLGLSRNILTAHIIAVLAGTLLFGLACAFSIVYLYQERRIKAKILDIAVSRIPALGTLENYNHKAITLGFFFLTLGILMGLLIAGTENLATRLFSPRQVIPAIDWMVYAVFLFIHDLQGRRGRFGAIWSIIGFALVIFTLIFEILSITPKG